MIRRDDSGRTVKYCDWCGKYCSNTGIDTGAKNFCSERCMRAYDRANGTEEGYRPGSFGQKMNRFFKKVEKIVGVIFVIAIVVFLLLEIFLPLIKK